MRRRCPGEHAGAIRVAYARALVSRSRGVAPRGWVRASLWLARDEPAAPAIVPSGCAACHGPEEGLRVGVHAGLPCQVCHGGDPSGTNVLSAHAGLEREAGALRSVETTCGVCHPDEAATVQGSLMATARGLIAVDRWAFGEVSDAALAAAHGSRGSDGAGGVAPHDETMRELLAVESPSPGQDHVARLCGGCHLNAVRDNRDDAIRGVGSGCGACHVAYDRPARGARDERAHPGIDGVVPDDRCLGCHSRSARISLSYQGLAEVSGTFVEDCEEPETLFDGRTGCRMPADVHFEAGLGCTDCHLHSELMGDGERHDRERDAVELRCESCHGDAEGRRSEATWAQIEDPVTRRLLALRGEEHALDEPVLTGARGTPIWNARPDGAGGWMLRAKDGSRSWPITATPRDDEHLRSGHAAMSCQACHSTWAPTCPTCHTSFDPAGRQWSFGSAGGEAGRWIETNEGMGFGLPGIGLAPARTGEGPRLSPEVPGMDATIDARAAGGEVREISRAAHFDPHTTQRAPRGCDSCHDGSIALGLEAGFGAVH